MEQTLVELVEADRLLKALNFKVYPAIGVIEIENILTNVKSLHLSLSGVNNQLLLSIIRLGGVNGRSKVSLEQLVSCIKLCYNAPPWSGLFQLVKKMVESVCVNQRSIDLLKLFENTLDDLIPQELNNTEESFEKGAFVSRVLSASSGNILPSADGVLYLQQKQSTFSVSSPFQDTSKVNDLMQYFITLDKLAPPRSDGGSIIIHNPVKDLSRRITF
jgi:hypothetical protein